MIEQVARALAQHHYTERFGRFAKAGAIIAKQHVDQDWRSFVPQARVAIKAMGIADEAIEEAK